MIGDIGLGTDYPESFAIGAILAKQTHQCTIFPVCVGGFGMPDQLTFVIDPTDEFSSLDLLVKSLEDIKRLLRDVDYAIYGRGSRHEQEWMVTSIRSSAPTITLAPQPERQQSVEIVGMGLKSITGGIDYPPEHFTETSLDDLKKMRRLFQGRGRARRFRTHGR